MIFTNTLHYDQNLWIINLFFFFGVIESVLTYFLLRSLSINKQMVTVVVKKNTSVKISHQICYMKIFWHILTLLSFLIFRCVLANRKQIFRTLSATFFFQGPFHGIQMRFRNWNRAKKNMYHLEQSLVKLWDRVLH